MNAESCVSFCEPAAAMDSFYNAASQGSTDGASPYRAFPGGGSDKFSPAFLAGKGQSGFGDGGSSSGGSGGSSGGSPKCRSRYGQGECAALDAGGGGGGPAAPAAASFSKYHPQPQPPPLYAQRGPCKSPPGGSLKPLQDPGSHNGALQLSCYGECRNRVRPPRLPHPARPAPSLPRHTAASDAQAARLPRP